MRLDLYWIPLGAGERSGQSVVRFFGRLYEAMAALKERRPRRALFHAALVVRDGDVTTTIEVAPSPDAQGPATRGVVAEGAVGSRTLGVLRVFRYEVRCWRGGDIPDLRFAVASPVLLTEDAATVERLLETLSGVPTPVWGRDDLGVGEMWNSNSVIAWALAHTALTDTAGSPPQDGRAPGWMAGVVRADRERSSIHSAGETTG